MVREIGWSTVDFTRKSKGYYERLQITYMMFRWRGCGKLKVFEYLTHVQVPSGITLTGVCRVWYAPGTYVIEGRQKITTCSDGEFTPTLININWYCVRFQAALTIFVGVENPWALTKQYCLPHNAVTRRFADNRTIRETEHVVECIRSRYRKYPTGSKLKRAMHTCPWMMNSSTEIDFLDVGEW